MKIISIVLAFIAFGMCFIGWNVVVFGPLLISFCAIISIVIATITLQKDNDNMLNILSIIISGISITIAIIFIALQLYTYTPTTTNDKTLEQYQNETILTEAKQIEVGTQIEIEDGLFLTINNIYYDTKIESIVINYDILNATKKDIIFNPNKLYYTSDDSIEPTFLTTTIVEPIVISGETNLVLQQATIKISGDVNTLGYVNSKGDSFEIPITTN